MRRKKFQFKKDGLVVKSPRLVVNNYPGLGYLYGKRVTVDKNRKLSVKTVRFFDGPWKVIGEKDTSGKPILSQLDLEHVGDTFAGTIIHPDTEKKIRFSGTLKDGKVTFKIDDPELPEEGRITAVLYPLRTRSGPQFRVLMGQATLTLVFREGNQKKEFSTSSNLSLGIRTQYQKEIVIKKLEKKKKQ